MSKVLWVAGASRSGKATLLNRLISDQGLRSKLNLGQVQLFARSLDVEGGKKEWPLSELLSSVSPSHTLLVKWQFRHHDRWYMPRLQQLNPKLAQTVLAIQCPQDALIERWTVGGRPYGGDDRERQAAYEVASLADRLSDIEAAGYHVERYTLSFFA